MICAPKAIHLVQPLLARITNVQGYGGDADALFYALSLSLSLDLAMHSQILVLFGQFLLLLVNFL